jgi:Family of unknown function (DUF5996)
MAEAADSNSAIWPRLDFADWSDTCATLHLWTQIVGKIRLKFAPMVNHWWQATLYVTARGLTTSPMPHHKRVLQIDFDFIDHQLVLRTSDGREERFALAPMSVADFYAEVMSRLRKLGVDVHIWTMPSEIADAIPFDQDRRHAAYDADAAQQFWRQLVQADRLLHQFRSGFLGKCSPVHFFWGSFDLAVTRFSGRRAPAMERGAPNVGAWVMREAYSHEVSSCGFWPGIGGFDRAAFYSYAYPEPDGFSAAPVRPDAAYYDDGLKQFILPYEAVRTSADPDRDVLAFLQTSYEACANRAGWHRKALERTQPVK